MAIKMQNRKGAVCVRVDGEEYALLEKVARGLNRPEWADKDNTPLTVFRSWVWSWVEECFEEKGKLAWDILDGVATDDEGLTAAPSPIHEERLAELRAAFEAEGLL